MSDGEMGRVISHIEPGGIGGDLLISVASRSAVRALTRMLMINDIIC